MILTIIVKMIMVTMIMIISIFLSACECSDRETTALRWPSCPSSHFPGKPKMLKGLSSHTRLHTYSKILQRLSSSWKSPLSSRNSSRTPPNDGPAAPPTRPKGDVIFGAACAGYTTFLLLVAGRLVHTLRKRREEGRRLAMAGHVAEAGGDAPSAWVAAPGGKASSSLLWIESFGGEVKVFELVVEGSQEGSWEKESKRWIETRGTKEDMAIGRPTLWTNILIS